MTGKIKRRSLRCGGRPKADFGSLFTSVIAPTLNAAGSIADESIDKHKTVIIPSDPTKTPTMRLGGRKKCWIGAAIGAATSIAGSLFGNGAKKREMRRQKSIQDWQTTTQEAANMSAALNNSQDYQEDYLRQFRTAARLGKRLGAKGIYITDGGDATKIDNNTYLLRGGSHEDVNETGQTGIGINVGGNEVEAEGGEVAQKKNGALRIFSAQPILANGMSPAQAILRGYNKDAVFGQQQAFKKRNGLKDDGSAKYGFGGDIKSIWNFIRSNRTPIDNIAALATAYQKLNPNSNYNKQKGKFKGGIFRGAGAGGTWTNDYKSNKGFDNFNDAYDDAVEHNAKTFIFGNKRYNTLKENNPIREINNRAVGSWRDSVVTKDRTGYGKDFGPIKGGASLIPVITETYNPKRIKHRLGGGLTSKDRGSSKHPYPSVSSKDFAGGGRSYPIPTKADAIDALRLAGLHGRSDVKAKVYSRYPELRKKAEIGTWVKPVYNTSKYRGTSRARTQIAKWEGSDFAGQNAQFKGDAIGAKERELRQFMGKAYNYLNDNQRDALLSYYYNLVPKTFRGQMIKYRNALINAQTEQEYNDTLNNMRESINVGANRKGMRGLRNRRAIERNWFGYTYTNPIQEKVDNNLTQVPDATRVVQPVIQQPVITKPIEVNPQEGYVPSDTPQGYNIPQGRLYDFIKDNMKRQLKYGGRAKADLGTERTYNLGTFSKPRSKADEYGFPLLDIYHALIDRFDDKNPFLITGVAPTPGIRGRGKILNDLNRTNKIARSANASKYFNSRQYHVQPRRTSVSENAVPVKQYNNGRYTYQGQFKQWQQGKPYTQTGYPNSHISISTEPNDAIHGNVGSWWSNFKTKMDLKSQAKQKRNNIDINNRLHKQEVIDRLRRIKTAGKQSKFINELNSYGDEQLGAMRPDSYWDKQMGRFINLSDKLASVKKTGKYALTAGTIGAGASLYGLSRIKSDNNNNNVTQKDAKGKPISPYIAKPINDNVISNKQTTVKKQVAAKSSTTKKPIAVPKVSKSVSKKLYGLNDNETKTINGQTYVRRGNQVFNTTTKVRYDYSNGKYTGHNKSYGVGDYSHVGKNFNDAFDAARTAGASKFRYNAGKYNQYTTAKETDAKKERLNRAIGARRMAKALGGYSLPVKDVRPKAELGWLGYPYPLPRKWDFTNINLGNYKPSVLSKNYPYARGMDDKASQLENSDNYRDFSLYRTQLNETNPYVQALTKATGHSWNDIKDNNYNLRYDHKLGYNHFTPEVKEDKYGVWGEPIKQKTWLDNDNTEIKGPYNPQKVINSSIDTKKTIPVDTKKTTEYEIRDNKFGMTPSTGDWVGLGIDTLAGLAGGIINYNAAKDMYIPGRAPIMLASKLPTNYNITPQLEEVKRMRDRLTGETYRNTSSSVAALNRAGNINLNSLNELSKLWTTKENEENKMLTQDALNQQSVAETNIRNQMARESEIAQYKNAQHQAKYDAINASLTGLAQAYNNFYTNATKRYEDEIAMRTYLAGSEAATPYRMLSMGVPMSTRSRIGLLNQVGSITNPGPRPERKDYDSNASWSRAIDKWEKDNTLYKQRGQYRDMILRGISSKDKRKYNIG